MNKTVSLEKIQKLQEEHNNVLGTNEYTKYLCECTYKNRTGNNWYFVGYCVPDREGSIKVIKGNTYLYTFKTRRYLLSETVKSILLGE